MRLDPGRIAERLMGMTDDDWARHANPLSGWSRVATLPLFVVAVWSRVWIGWWALVPVAAIAAWTWINPRLFGPPGSLDAWMSRGVLGERIWLARRERPIPVHHARMAGVLNGVSFLGTGLMVWGLIDLSEGLTLAGMVIAMGAKLWFLDRMVWLEADRRTGRG